MIHTGSRGFGHQVCTDALGVMQGAHAPLRHQRCPTASWRARRSVRPRRGRISARCGPPRTSPSPTGSASPTSPREAFERALGVSPRDLGWRLVYDVAHNIAKEEEHEVDGRRRRLLVHRKGATRAFPPAIPSADAYRRGQPVLIPGDMGRYSFVLVGTQGAMRETFGSTCHGAGRVLSRTAAVKAARGRRSPTSSAARGWWRGPPAATSLAEEMPEAYKDVADVVDVVHRFGSRRASRGSGRWA